jgi:hypothetical protein
MNSRPHTCQVVTLPLVMPLTLFALINFWRGSCVYVWANLDPNIYASCVAGIRDMHYSTYLIG